MNDYHNNKQKEQDLNEPEGEDLDFTKPNFVFRPNDTHSWRQRGPYLICRTCDLEHAIWVGMDQLMAGVKENGEPILQKKVVY